MHSARNANAPQDYSYEASHSGLPNPARRVTWTSPHVDYSKRLRKILNTCQAVTQNAPRAGKVWAETGLSHKKRLSGLPVPPLVRALMGQTEYLSGRYQEGKGVTAAERNVNRCKFCGDEVDWLQGKPVQAGRDHRETCAGIVSATRRRIADENHELAVARFLTSISKSKKGR